MTIGTAARDVCPAVVPHVQQHDRTRSHPFDDVARDARRARGDVLVGVRFDVPGHGSPATSCQKPGKADELVAEGRPEVDLALVTSRSNDRVGPLDLFPNESRRSEHHPPMRVRVVAEFMSCGDEPSSRVWRGGQFAARHEERRADMACGRARRRSRQATPTPARHRRSARPLVPTSRFWGPADRTAGSYVTRASWRSPTAAATTATRTNAIN